MRSWLCITIDVRETSKCCRQLYAALVFALFTAAVYQLLLLCVTAVAAAIAALSLSLSLCDDCLIQDGLCKYTKRSINESRETPIQCTF
jgi:hypothetical protein